MHKISPFRLYNTPKPVKIVIYTDIPIGQAHCADGFVTLGDPSIS